jgi:hypothetical protein
LTFEEIMSIYENKIVSGYEEYLGQVNKYPKYFKTKGFARK